MKVKFYLKRPKGAAETVIYASICFDKQRIKYYTDLNIHPKHWNKSAQEARVPNQKGGGDFITSAPEFNVRLRGIRSAIEAVAYRYNNTHQGRIPSRTQLVTLLDKEFDKNTAATQKELALQSFWGYFNDFIERCESGSRLHLKNDTPLAKNTIKNLKNLKTHLNAYEKWKGAKLNFETFDMQFHRSFTDYLTKEKKLQVNTMGKLITNVKVVLQEALEDGKNKFNVFQHRKFKSYQVESDQIYLKDNEIIELWELDLKDNTKLERVRDMFIVGCLTGLRHVDIKALSGQHLVEGTIEITQAKTGKAVYIPARRIVREIFDKYDGELPSMTNQKFNEYIKEVCEKCTSLKKLVPHTTVKGGKKSKTTVPKYKLVSSHCMRRSFCTNEYLAEELTVAEIRSISGHKSERAFFKYIKMTPRENAHNVAKKFNERDKEKGVMYIVGKAV